MRSKSFIALVALVVVLAAVVGGAYAYDAGRHDLIGKNVSVGGVDVSGLRADQARARLRDQLVDPLNRAVVARYHGKRFSLTPRQARVAVDVDRSVQAAVERSRRGSIVSRTFRGLTGGRTNAKLAVDISYDKAAVRRLAARVSRTLERPAVDAGVDISGAGVATKPSHMGLAVNKRALRRMVGRQLLSRTASRTVPVRTETLKPKVSSGDLTSKYPSIVVVDRNSFTLKLYEHLKESKDYKIAVGMAGLETPAGLYNIQDKQVNPYWHVPNSAWAGSLAGTTVPPGPSNPLQKRWMGIYNGAGIHGTSDVGSLGSAASHGCIRMAIPDVENLFDRVAVGTPVYVA
ncbi:MAG: L,D-transpeptidase family protein [Solirubrobacteraceae bacterium]